jgi:hypothetical protein
MSASRLAGVAVLAAVVALVVTACGGGSEPARPAQATVRPIPRGADAREQARNIAAWLRARSAARP